MPSSLFLTDAIWQVKADNYDCELQMLILKMTPCLFIYLFCSHPKGVGCAAQKVPKRKVLSSVFPTETKDSAHLNNGTDITSGMSVTGTIIY